MASAIVQLSRQVRKIAMKTKMFMHIAMIVMVLYRPVLLYLCEFVQQDPPQTGIRATTYRFMIRPARRLPTVPPMGGRI